MSTILPLYLPQQQRLLLLCALLLACFCRSYHCYSLNQHRASRLLPSPYSNRITTVASTALTGRIALRQSPRGPMLTTALWAAAADDDIDDHSNSSSSSTGDHDEDKPEVPQQQQQQEEVTKEAVSNAAETIAASSSSTTSVTIASAAAAQLTPDLSPSAHVFLFLRGLLSVLRSNWLILGEIFVIWLAHHNPALGATGGPLRPEFTISKLGVFAIFFINGVALSIGGGDKAEALQATKTNFLIQSYNFGFIPLLVKAIVKYYPDAAFREGIMVLACIPGTINICVAQTLAAGGNMGIAIFNAIFANVLGVFLTPVLAIWMLGVGEGVSLLGTLAKLGNVVILPLALGQLARRTPIGVFFQRINKYSRFFSSCLLLAIVYNVFSDTFQRGIGVAGGALLHLLLAMPLAYLLLSGGFWLLAKRLLPGLDPSTRAAALLCSSQRTLAFGIPFIKTAFGSRPDIAYILAPLLLYAPAQLLLGSALLVPALRKQIQQQQQFESGAGI